MGQGDSFPAKIVSDDDKESLHIKGYRSSRLKKLTGTLIVLATFGLLAIFLAWRKELRMRLFFKETPLQHATKVLLKDGYNVYWIEDVVQQRSTDALAPKNRYFVNKQIKYFWDHNTLQFMRSSPFDKGKTCKYFHEYNAGLNLNEVDKQQQDFGSNFIKIEVLPIYKMALIEMTNPFYMFQIYTIIIWMAQQYYDYSSVVILATCVAVGTTVYETRKQMTKLRKRVQTAGSVIVIRGGVEKRILSQQIVPGDVLCISPMEDKVPFYCDAVLIEGTCSVDESMLTGESHPISKIPVPYENETFDYSSHKRHILYSGTQLLQGRTVSNHQYLKAIVIRTGYMTNKGDLIRAILFPKPIHFRFYVDLVRVVMLFLIIGLGGMVYSFYSWIRNGGTLSEIILNSLDVVSFVVPPMLPAALTATTLFAQRRLKAKNIFCMSSKHITLCGGVDVVCFDKTGTLTESDVDFGAVVPVDNRSFCHPISELGTLPDSSVLLKSIATCHSLVLINGKLTGYSVDKKMLEASNWEFEEGPSGVNSNYGVETLYLARPPDAADRRRKSRYDHEVAVLKRFPFDSNVKRMTVICQSLGSSRYSAFIKGAPEVIASLCDRDTVPENFKSVLKSYTLQGYRVLAIAGKVFRRHDDWNHVQRLSREEVEENAELLGLLVIQNSLKKETLRSIRILQQACIQTVMVTGDNIQTAITVAKECEMIKKDKRVIQVEAEWIPSSVNAVAHLQVVYSDPLAAPEFLSGTLPKMRDVHTGNFVFAMEGSTFELLRIQDPVLLNKCIHRGKVFARMSPEHKQHLIEALQQIGRQVAMVGDGCNDCSALRTADAGISISPADASVAAPFTSLVTNISCVDPWIREGRTTLDAAFGTFFFSVSTSLIMFVGVLMLYSISTEPSDFQWFVWSYGIITIPYFTIGNISPPEFLHPRRPFRHLWAFLPLFSFFTFLIWQTIVLLIGWFYCHSQSWFEPYVFEKGKYPTNASYEETTMYMLMCIGCIVSAFVYSPSQPYSRNAFTNRVFAAWSVQVIVLMLCEMFITDQGFADQMNFKTPPHPEYMVVILFLGLAGGVFSVVWEKYIIRGAMYQWIWPRLNKLRSDRHSYQAIERELNATPNWPQLGRRESINRQIPSIQVQDYDERSSLVEEQPAVLNGDSQEWKEKQRQYSMRTFRGRAGNERNAVAVTVDLPPEVDPLLSRVEEELPPVPSSPLPDDEDEESCLAASDSKERSPSNSGAVRVSLVAEKEDTEAV